MNLNKIVYFSAVISFLGLQSCATILRSKTQMSISVTSSPSNASVFLKDKKIGTTPMEYKFKKRKKKTLEIQKEGYLTEYRSIERKINPLWTGISVVGGLYAVIGVAIVIDFMTGNVDEVHTDAIVVTLKPLTGRRQGIPSLSSTTTKIPSRKNGD